MELTDEHFMRRAIELAERGGVAVAPNPKVGAVIVYNQQIIGEGFHQKYGENHAEVEAVNSVKDKQLLKDSTIYVTLEPCSHYGKTPPCCDLLIRSQFKRVVIGNQDPNVAVNGRGIQQMKEVGIEVTVGVLEEECRFMNRRFLTVQEKKRPYIILKWAESKDGFLDKKRMNNVRQINAITDEDCQKLVHQWRGEEQAILVGWKTILNDDPQLNVRWGNGQSPIRIVLDANLNAPEASNAFQTPPQTIVYNKKKNFLNQNLHYIQLKELTFDAIFDSLLEQGINSVFVEGGGYTLNQFIEHNVWDEIRRFRGEIEFHEGVEAPNINLLSNETRLINQNRLDIFYNKRQNGRHKKDNT